MVVLPATIFAVLIIRAVRSERLRLDYQQTLRQRQVARLVETDLHNWLFSTRSDSAISKALLQFRIENGRIVFPGFELALPDSPSPQRPPIASMPPGTPLTAQSIAEHYYPRIQAFLRDMSAGQNPGAQYFLRLRALTVRLPGLERGYVLDVDRVIEYVNRRLTEFCAAEDFRAVLWVGSIDREDAWRAPANAVGLQGFPFFHVMFSDAAPTAAPDLRRYGFAYAIVSLVLVTLLGSVFVHRAVAHEVRLSHLKTDFVSAVSHEFRSPLSAILALTERLESARVSDPKQLGQYHQIIGNEARRLSVLVTRLLDFAQIEEGRKVYALDRVELVAIAREAVQACHHLGRPERLHLHGEESAPLWVRADRTALRHAVQNLIENAIKYSPLDSPVTITCIVENGSNMIDVRDQGIGIPPREQQKIFDKFYRGPQASGLNVQGVGIGLALVKHVMDSHGGSVLVESQPGQGSRFRLVLPRADI